jgi:hypothetical protein
MPQTTLRSRRTKKRSQRRSHSRSRSRSRSHSEPTARAERVSLLLDDDDWTSGCELRRAWRALVSFASRALLMSFRIRWTQSRALTWRLSMPRPWHCRDGGRYARIDNTEPKIPSSSSHTALRSALTRRMNWSADLETDAAQHGRTHSTSTGIRNGSGCQRQRQHQRGGFYDFFQDFYQHCRRTTYRLPGGVVKRPQLRCICLPQHTSTFTYVSLSPSTPALFCHHSTRPPPFSASHSPCLSAVQCSVVLECMQCMSWSVTATRYYHRKGHKTRARTESPSAWPMLLLFRRGHYGDASPTAPTPLTLLNILSRRFRSKETPSRFRQTARCQQGSLPMQRSALAAAEHDSKREGRASRKVLLHRIVVSAPSRLQRCHSESRWTSVLSHAELARHKNLIVVFAHGRGMPRVQVDLLDGFGYGLMFARQGHRMICRCSRC